MSASLLRIPIDLATQSLSRILQTLAMTPDRAQRCAQLFVAASRDGVTSHGLDRFPGFVKAIQKNIIDPHAQPRLLLQSGPLERWDGQRGPGPLNASFAMDHAIQLARKHGIGCVGLCHTNHWMRAGNYGWQAADAGFIGLCWTNTIALMPPWGAAERKLGNNPLVIAIPRSSGHLVLDMALSQFSMGKLQTLLRQGQPTPFPGGYDQQGILTTDPAAIIESGRLQPIGLWKGAGLALMLDILAAAISGGNSTRDLTANGNIDTGVSQVFLAINPDPLGGAQALSQIADAVLADLVGTPPLDAASPVLYPGQRTLDTRRQSLAQGIPVAPATWSLIQNLETTLAPQK